MSAASNAPMNDRRQSGAGQTIVWAVLLICIGAAIALFVSAPAEQHKTGATQQDEPIRPFGANAADECRRLSGNATEDLPEQQDKLRYRMRQAACSEAFASAPDDVRNKVAFAQSLPHERHAEAVALLREAAARNDSEANYAIYDSHNSWDYHLDRPQLITRDEAQRALIKAAELDKPSAANRLAILYGRGGLVKRDPSAERYWTERALRLPLPENVTRADQQIRLARLLARSPQPDEQTLGRDLLERLAQGGSFGAKAALAAMTRPSDPVRARKLFEEATRDRLGGDTELAEMLLNGEGGPADPKRALLILQSQRHQASASGLLGELYLDGKLVPRDVSKGIDLLITAGVWDYDSRLKALRLLADHPEVQISSLNIVLYEAIQAAELGEPDALAALVGLKLSQNPQFRDVPGACKLKSMAVQRGDQDAVQRLKDCPAD
ncbi:tetratricopeptide repeat protein [Tardiphaga sp. 768_D3_N2_1]|uniref:tetratricopeptide repeat protein n=1 Tax=Tardiphaga sp. 768_D3_N2_1 TaxID=3240783 RepID=UPI003F8A5E5A